MTDYEKITHSGVRFWITFGWLRRLSDLHDFAIAGADGDAFRCERSGKRLDESFFGGCFPGSGGVDSAVHYCGRVVHGPVSADAVDKSSST